MAIGATVMLAPIVPFDQTMLPVQVPLAVSVVVSPAQISVLVAEMVGAVGLPTVIVTGFELALVQVPTLQTAV